MKKLYSQPEWKVTFFKEDAITTSGDGDGTYTYGKDIVEAGNFETWWGK